MHSQLREALSALLFVATSAVVHANGPALEVLRADEYRVKAAMLFNFARFVEWPAEAFSSPDMPLDLCIVGADPFGAVLDDSLRGHLVAGRAIQVRRMADIQPGCHLAFVSGSERRRMSVIADRLRSAGTLTVAEDEGFGIVGGMIELFTDGDSIRFNIYPPAIERSKLRASARLIALAANQKRPGGHR
ncbi:MAG TPA: YfiR family protein [Vicinamibacterales bacterium]|nr:YfiR family protein [Vicinamibacterales bacterium]